MWQAREHSPVRRITALVRLLLKFYKTEIIGGVEFMVWSAVHQSDIYLLLWNSPSVRPVMMVALLAIPVVSAIGDYSSQKDDIKKIISVVIDRH